MSNIPPSNDIEMVIQTFDKNIKAKEAIANTDYERGYLQALIDAKTCFTKLLNDRETLRTIANLCN